LNDSFFLRIKMRKVVVFFLFFAIFYTLSAWDEFNQYSIADELKKPGVKLVAVDFYATWCEPCNAAIPKWKKLQEKYGDKGFKLIVVSVQSEGSCSQPPQWNPDKIVCDYDGDIADAWHANDLPQAFLWSWQGNLLVAHGGVDNVAAAIEKYFKKIPRVYVEEGADKNIYQLVRSKLRENSKIEIVASDAERKALAELRKKSSNMNFDTKLQCKLGEEISANSRLVISKQKRGKKDALVLELFSVEKGCLTASGTATMRGNIDTEVAEAVYNLLKNLLGTVSMPSEGGVSAKPKKQAPKSNFQTGRFGGKTDDWEIGGGEETIVKFESSPSGAVVLADGKLLCQSTPCSKLLTQGNHEIEMQKENYVPNSQKQDIKEGKTIKYKLDPDFAWLSVTGNYAVSLRLDGANIGEIPIKEKTISTGNHKIEHTDGCYYDLGETFTVKRGEKKNIKFDLEHRESAIKVYAQDEKGNDIDADVFVDDKKVGRAPGTFKVPLCSKEMRVKKSGYSEHSERLSLQEKQVKTFQAKMRSDKPANRGYAGSGSVSGSNLQWSNKAPNRMDWDDAINYCKNLNEGGHNDWRLPNIDELRSLIQNHSGTQTGGSCPISEKAGKLSGRDWINDCDSRNGSNFSKLGDTGWFWSSSTLSDGTSYAWHVNFNDGSVYDSSKSSSNKAQQRYVRCVR